MGDTLLYQDFKNKFRILISLFKKKHCIQTIFLASSAWVTIINNICRMCSVGHLVSQSRVCWWWYKNQWTTCGTCSPTDLIRGWQDEEETGGHNIATMPTQHCNHPLNIRVGRFCTFFRILRKGRYKTGIYQIFLILVQKPVRGTPLKVHIFKKIQGTNI